MPRFEYTAKKGPNEAEQGALDAENRTAALARLRDLGYTPVHLEEVVAESAVVKRGFRKKKIGLKERNNFFRQLANLLESGMMLSRALRTLTEQTEHPGLQKMIQNLQDDVRQGRPFAEALEAHPKVFSNVIVSMVRAGETGGMLDEVLWRIVEFGEQEEELRGKVVTALVYPIFLLCVGGISIFILVSFVFPKFIAVFDSFNAELPWMTKFVMAGCGFMGDWWWAILLAGALLVISLRAYVRTDAGRHQWHALLLRVPMLRTVLMKMYMAAFARTFGALVDNGVNVLSALRTTADTVNNVHIYEAVQQAHDSVKDGASLSEALGQSQRFPADVVNLFAVGEESGRVGAMAKRLSHMYDLEVDRAVSAAMSLFEPMLIVLMGVIVGFLVVAMLMPMLTLSSAIGV